MHTLIIIFFQCTYFANKDSAHTTHTHTHTISDSKSNGNEEKVFEKRRVFKEELKELTDIFRSVKKKNFFFLVGLN